LARESNPRLPTMRQMLLLLDHTTVIKHWSTNYEANPLTTSALKAVCTNDQH